jgi:hypothetical protein
MFTSDWLSEKERDERERDLKRAEYVKVIDGIMMMMMVMVL